MTVRSLFQFFKRSHAHSEPSSARIDVITNKLRRLHIDTDLDVPHGRDPDDSPIITIQIIGNNGAEMMALNVGHFADLGMEYVPKRHSDSVCMRVPKCPTF